MGSRHRVSRTAIELIQRFEGYRRLAAQLPDGRWTIGYGHTRTARAGAEVSKEDAEALLIYDLIGVAHLLNENVYAPLNQNQFDALASFAFNLGEQAFRTSEVLKRLNQGQLIQAACAMELWRKAEFEGEAIVIDAMVRRRAAEKLLFLTPPDGTWVPAPSPILRPLADAGARDLVPADAPVELQASLDGDRAQVRREGGAPQPGGAVRAAAEAVSSRLQTYFVEPPSEAAPEAPEEPRPQADFAPPITPHAPEPEPQPPEDDLPEPEPAGDAATEEPPPASAEAGPDLPEPERGDVETAPRDEAERIAEELSEAFEVPTPPDSAAAPEAEAAGPRVRIDDTAPYEFIPARVAPLPRKREPSIVLDLLLALLGLAFFAAALVWGMAAQPEASGPVAPEAVAWLAGVAGVGFLGVAVFRLLQRLSRAAEQD